MDSVLLDAHGYTGAVSQLQLGGGVTGPSPPDTPPTLAATESIVATGEIVVQAPTVTLPGASFTPGGITLPETSGGLSISGAPAGAERSLQWTRNEGDSAGDGSPMAPHQTPRWLVSGGALSIASATAQWFLSPHTAITGDSLGLYYQANGGDAVLVQLFAT
jgi:hypothetical protein